MVHLMVKQVEFAFRTKRLKSEMEEHVENIVNKKLKELEGKEKQLMGVLKEEAFIISVNATTSALKSLKSEAQDWLGEYGRASGSSSSLTNVVTSRFTAT